MSKRVRYVILAAATVIFGYFSLLTFHQASFSSKTTSGARDCQAFSFLGNSCEYAREFISRTETLYEPYNGTNLVVLPLLLFAFLGVVTWLVRGKRGKESRNGPALLAIIVGVSIFVVGVAVIDTDFRAKGAIEADGKSQVSFTSLGSGKVKREVVTVTGGLTTSEQRCLETTRRSLDYPNVQSDCSGPQRSAGEIFNLQD